MKKHRAFLVSIAVLSAMTLSLASCDLLGGEKKHEHTYGDAWSTNETKHWHDANCTDTDDCASAKKDEADHTFENGECTECGYEQAKHEHTYADTWSASETHHWHAATCSDSDACKTEVKDKAEHTFVNGVCTECKYQAKLGTKHNPNALTVPGNLTVNYTANADPVWYVFTAEKDAVIGIKLSNGAKMGYGTDKEEMTFTTDTEVTFDIVEGTTYYVNFSSADFSAAKINVSAVYVDTSIGNLTGSYIGENVVGSTKDLMVTIVSDQDLAGGTITFTRHSMNKEEIVEHYKYKVVEGEFVFLFENGNEVTYPEGQTVMAGFTLKNGKPATAISNGTEYTLEYVGAAVEKTGLEDSYTATYKKDNKEDSFRFYVTTFQISVYISDGSPLLSTIVSDYTYNKETGVLTLDSEGELGAYTFTVVDGKITAVIFEGNTYTVAADADKVVSPDGTQNHPYVLTLPGQVTTSANYLKETWYTFTVEQDGILTLAFSDANSWASLRSEGNSETKTTEQTMTFEVHANVTYQLGVALNNEAESAITADVSFTAQALAKDGDFEKPIKIEDPNFVDWSYSASYTFSTEAENDYVWFQYECDSDVMLKVTLSGAANVKHGTATSLTSKENVTELSYNAEAPMVYLIGVQKSDLSEITVKVKADSAPGASVDSATQIDMPAPTATVKAEGNTYGRKWYSFTATANGKLTVEFPDTNSCIQYDLNLGIPGLQDGYGQKSYEINIEKDKTYTFGLGVDILVAADFDVTLTFEEGKAVNVLAGDTQTVNANTEGVLYAFTAKQAGTYTLSWTATNAVIWVDGAAITSGYEFTLEKDASITFVMKTTEGEGSYEVTIAAKEEEVEANALLIGVNTVNAGTEADVYTFTAKAAGTYKISWTDENAEVVAETGSVSETIANGYEFTLSERESIKFIMYTLDWSEGSYEVTIAGVEEEVDTNALVIGVNTVNASFNGTAYTFTAETAGTYLIKYDYSADFMIYALTTDGSALVESEKTEIVLVAGEAKTLLMTANSDATYTVTIALKA